MHVEGSRTVNEEVFFECNVSLSLDELVLCYIVKADGICSKFR